MFCPPVYSVQSDDNSCNGAWDGSGPRVFAGELIGLLSALWTSAVYIKNRCSETGPLQRGSYYGMNASLPSRTSISALSPSALASTYLDVKPSRLKALLPSGVAVRAARWGAAVSAGLHVYLSCASPPPLRTLKTGLGRNESHVPEYPTTSQEGNLLPTRDRTSSSAAGVNGGILLPAPSAEEGQYRST